MDYSPGELPNNLPETIWVWWDSCGEYMDTTDDPAEGARWMRDAANGCGFAASYVIESSMGD